MTFSNEVQAMDANDDVSSHLSSIHPRLDEDKVATCDDQFSKTGVIKGISSHLYEDLTALANPIKAISFILQGVLKLFLTYISKLL